MIINVTGAYGRSYKGKEDAQKDWNADRDFLVLTILGGAISGTYINRSDKRMFASTATVNVKTASGYHTME